MNIFDLHAKVKRVISGCSSIQQLEVADRYNDLFTERVHKLYPELAKDWGYYDPYFIKPSNETANAMLVECSFLLRGQRKRLGY